jgi:hypothetical protein
MIAENVRHIRHRIAQACEKCGRSPDDIVLVAVSKTFTSDNIREAVSAGALDIGENYVQELVTKKKEVNDEKIRWHFIGHLQRNKVKDIIPWIYLIHSVDSLRLGEAISHCAEKFAATMNILVEVNTSRETTKYGVPPEETLKLVEQLSSLPYINCSGLMTIGPFLPDPEQSRPAFRTLRELKNMINEKGFRLQHLSMGMTNDFEVAIEEGATIVRIGTAIFGKRTPNHTPHTIETTV